MRDKRFVQLYAGIKVLSRLQGATIKELEEALGVKRRQVSRFLATVEALGYPLYDELVDGGPEKRWKFNRSDSRSTLRAPPFVISPEEILALAMLRAEAGSFRGTEIETVLDGFFEKVAIALPPDFLARLQRIRTLFVPSSKMAKEYTGKEELIQDLTQAMLAQRVCAVRYTSFSKHKEVTFRLAPLHFFEHQGGLYCFYLSPDHGDIRMVAVERIQSLDLEEATFEYPKDFDPQALLDTSFGVILGAPMQVKIRFAPCEGRYIKERRWARNQTLTDLPDGGLLLEMEVSGRREVLMWVLGFGGNAEVLEPEELREMVKGEVGRIGLHYSST